MLMVSPNHVVEDTVAHNVSEDETKQERAITSGAQILPLFGWWYHANKASVLLDLIGSYGECLWLCDSVALVSYQASYIS